MVRKEKNASISIELRSLSNLIRRFFENSSNKTSVQKITGANGWIIAYIAENADEDVFQRDLEAEFGVTRSTASKVVNLMVQKGLIERQSVPYDARLKKLTLTDKALEIYKLMDEDLINLEKLLAKGFSEEELELLFSFIERMKKNLE